MGGLHQPRSNSLDMPGNGPILARWRKCTRFNEGYCYKAILYVEAKSRQYSITSSTIITDALYKRWLIIRNLFIHVRTIWGKASWISRHLKYHILSFRSSFRYSEQLSINQDISSNRVCCNSDVSQAFVYALKPRKVETRKIIHLSLRSFCLGSKRMHLGQDNIPFQRWKWKVSSTPQLHLVLRVPPQYHILLTAG